MAGMVQEIVGLLDLARRKGARGAEILVTETDGATIDVQRGKVARAEPYHTASVLVRAWTDDGREGTATGLSLDAVPTLFDRALEAAARVAPDPHGGPVGRLSVAVGGLGIDDKRHAQLTMADRADVVLASEKAARTTDRRARTENFRYVDGRTLRRFANTRGLALEEWSTLYRALGTVIIADDRAEIALSDDLASRAFASTASLPYGAGLAHRVAALLGDPVPVEGPIRVMMPPRVVASLFEILGALFTPESLQSGAHFLAKAAREADRPRDGDWPVPEDAPVGLITDSRLHLLDDGTVPGSLRTCGFDDRGVTPVPLTLLREGRVDARFLDPNTARRLDTRPTGHVHGGVLRPNNLLIRAGTRSMNALMSEIPEPILLLDHLDWAQGLDLATGEVRARAAGQLTRKGRTEGPVRDIALVANLLDVLTRVVEIASDTDRQGHVDAPGILVDGFVAQRA